MNRTVAAVAIAACLGLIAWSLWPRKAPSDADLVRALVSDCAKAAGEHDLSRLMAHVSEDYSGEFGDKTGLRSGLGAWMFTARDVGAAETNVDVQVTGASAIADFTVVLARSGTTDPGGRLGSRRVHAELAKRDGTWLVTRATSRDAAPGDFLP